MRVLALDTATEACSVALLTDAGVVGAWREVGRGHAELILDMVHAVLSEAGVALGMLDGIAASVGPGAFTGVRIGVSVAQGLAFGAALPVVAVTTLEALGWQAMRAGAEQVMACLDARMAKSTGAVLRPIPSTVSPHAARRRWATRIGQCAPGGAVSGIGRGFAAYPILQSLAGLSLPAGACDALPDAKDMARLGASGLSSAKAGTRPISSRSICATRWRSRKRNVPGLKQAAPE